MPGWGYWFGALVYGGLGAFVAWIFSDGTKGDAFKLGVIAPALVISFSSGATPESGAVAWGLFSTRAVAQESKFPEEQPPISGNSKQMMFWVTREGWAGELPDQLQVKYTAPDETPVIMDVSVGEKFHIPSSVNSVIVDIGKIAKTIDVPENGADVSLKFKQNQSFRSQLLWALTGQPTIGGPQIDADISAD
jgi:hypothetical protein